MKKIFLPIITLLISVSAFAADYGQAQLTINTYNQRNLFVVIDGVDRTINTYDGSVTIADLSSGNHDVRIYEQSKRGFFGRKSNRLLYQSNLYLRSNYITTLLIRNDNNISVTEQPMYNKKDRGRHKGWDKNGKNDDRGWHGQAMDQRSFELLKQQIRNGSFDNTKVDIAKTGMHNNWFTAQQAKEMVQLLSFESNKLEVAKYAYDYCVDPQNYYCINDAFSFTSSKEELNRFIQQSS